MSVPTVANKLAKNVSGLNKPVSYRNGIKTSKITIHPSLFNALTRKFGSDKDARHWIRDMACEASSLSLSPSHYVREKALQEVLPSELKKGYTLTLGMIQLTYSTDSEVREMTKKEEGKPLYTSVLSLSCLMIHAINKLDEDAGKFTRTQKMKGLSRNNIAEMANDYWKTLSGEDVSFYVKQELIDALSAY